MTRTTPPRPVDVEGVFPALARHRRTATRLHPRQGRAKPEESSVAGPLLWPADEPWPVCTAVHRKGTGRLLSDVRLRRRIQDEARGRDFTAEERWLLDGMTRGTHVPALRDEDPLPMLAVAQLHARDVPDLVGPEGHDLLQVFWCPFEAHGPERTIDVELRWRRSADVGAVLDPQPEPPVAGREECVPTSCVVHPERVVEHEYLGLLGEELQEEIADWEESLLDEENEGKEDEEEDAYDSSSSASYATYEEYEAAMAAARAQEPEEIDYMSDLSIAPGWKVGGFASWHLTDPGPVDCPACGTPMPPLLTVAAVECDGASRSWLPVEDRDAADDPRVIDPVGVHLGRGLMRVHTCPTDPAHPHRLTFQ
ncbi:hypothetical protein [Streptomyces sp. TLI_105]|uniref:hypothetical protein n=1 Tax=Streptomyces sp. TLI_105 TaxID=1881019 RepID=UPI0008989C94|nr:hypothetical protein [Streptomyces sp. TLI_105]SEB66077.1 hypothetical protein SAMN05428939_0357 [Streptomyces sp. TLI_105]